MAKWQYYILPIVLLICLPAEITTAFIRRVYPTQATLLVLINFGIGLWLIQKINQYAPKFSAELGKAEAEPEEVLEIDNSRLNRMLGVGFLVFGFLLTLFLLISFVMITPRTVSSSSTASTIIEIGFIVTFNLMIAALIWFGAKIYLSGLK
jgi:hypothetical protein